MCAGVLTVTCPMTYFTVSYDLYSAIFRDVNMTMIQERQRERREKKLRELLEDYFYRSDHLDVPWEQGREKIGKHSASKEMEEEDW